MGLVEWLWPKFCVGCGEGGGWLCEGCKRRLVVGRQKCPECERPSVGGYTHERCRRKWGLDGLFMVYEYRGLMKRVVREIKYRFCKELVEECLAGVRREKYGTGVAVAVPLHRKRENWRGFNQAEAVAGALGLPVEDWLERTKGTKPLAEMGKVGRGKEILGVFRLRKGAEVKGRNILLVDDVCTTGATLREAAKVLKRAGARKVYGWVLAG